MKTPRSAFTLIELLVVIAILGILMSLLFPAVNSAMDAAKKTQAQNAVTQIALAVRNYETEYGRPLGSNASAVDVGGPMLQALMGTNVNNLNPRQIVFLEVNAWKKNRGGITNNKYCDPFQDDRTKDPNAYQIVFAPNYGNTIASVGSGKWAGTNLMAKVAVYMQTNKRFNGVNKTPATSW